MDFEIPSIEILKYLIEFFKIKKRAEAMRYSFAINPQGKTSFFVCYCNIIVSINHYMQLTKNSKFNDRPNATQRNTCQSGRASRTAGGSNLMTTRPLIAIDADGVLLDSSLAFAHRWVEQVIATGRSTRDRSPKAEAIEQLAGPH